MQPQWRLGINSPFHTILLSKPLDKAQWRLVATTGYIKRQPRASTQDSHNKHCHTRYATVAFLSNDKR